jgi:copper chaperone
MTCGHCADSVRRAIRAASGIERVTVDLRSGTATLEGQDHPLAAIIRAIEALGYDARLREKDTKD